MNSWPNELMAEYHRQRIREAVKQVHLERSALQGHAHRPRFFERTMFNFGKWMISIGKQLCKRYEAPNGNYSMLSFSK